MPPLELLSLTVRIINELGSLVVKTVLILRYSTPLDAKMLLSRLSRFCWSSYELLPSILISSPTFFSSIVLLAKACSHFRVTPEISARFGWKARRISVGNIFPVVAFWRDFPVNWSKKLGPPPFSSLALPSAVWFLLKIDVMLLNRPPLSFPEDEVCVCFAGAGC